MGYKQIQKRSTCGGGLMREIIAVLGGLTNVQKVIHGETRGYRGDRKVKIPDLNWWSKCCLVVSVCDADDGERTLLIYSPMPSAIGRVLGKRLEERGINVC